MKVNLGSYSVFLKDILELKVASKQKKEIYKIIIETGNGWLFRNPCWKKSDTIISIIDRDDEIVSFGILENIEEIPYLRMCITKPEYRRNGYLVLLVVEILTKTKGFGLKTDQYNWPIWHHMGAKWVSEPILELTKEKGGSLFTYMVMDKQNFIQYFNGHKYDQGQF